MPAKPDLPPARLAALINIYGADPRRWPAAEAHHAADADLSNAEIVDHFLDFYAVSAPSSALIGQIFASATYSPRLWSRAQYWWSGLGLTGIALAGAAAGALAISATAPAAVYHPGTAFADEQTTAFDAADTGESDL